MRMQICRSASPSRSTPFHARINVVAYPSIQKTRRLGYNRLGRNKKRNRCAQPINQIRWQWDVYAGMDDGWWTVPDAKAWLTWGWETFMQDVRILYSTLYLWLVTFFITMDHSICHPSPIYPASLIMSVPPNCLHTDSSVRRRQPEDDVVNVACNYTQFGICTL